MLHTRVTNKWFTYILSYKYFFVGVEKQFHTKKSENDIKASQSVCKCLRGVV